MDTPLEISHIAIRNARMRAGLSVVELAERVPGVHAKTIYDIEKGNPCRISTVRKLAEGLGVPVETLLAPAPAAESARAEGVA